MKENSNENSKTDTWNELFSLIDELHREAEELARARKTEKLHETSDWLRRASELKKRYEALHTQAERLISERHIPRNESNTNDFLSEQITDRHSSANGETPSRRPGGKPRARDCRLAYLTREKSQGKTLRRDHSLYYRNDSDTVVGITFSSKDEKKGTWFLNLQEGEFQEAVLLCETDSELVQIIHLPKDFFARYGRQLSQDESGKVKFNLKQSNGHFLLQVPDPIGWVDVMKFVESKPLICPRKDYE